MIARITWPDSFTARVSRARRASVDLAPVMPELERLTWRDNRDGLLAGTDKDGRRMRRLAERTIKYRRSETGIADPHAPPLVPARERSRAIANYRITSFPVGVQGNWMIVGAWQNVLSKRGVPFLGFHATGTAHLPRRDIFGVRPKGRRAIGAALKEWLRETWTNP